MGKSLEYKMACGCELWVGNDYQGKNYLQIECCPCHKNVVVEDLNDCQPKMENFPQYGQTIKWTHFDGTEESCSVEGCKSIEEARKLALNRAKKSGWVSPKLWQWWRWGDTKIDNQEFDQDT